MSPFRPDALRGTVALVTSGGSGICFGIAQVMGAHVTRRMLMGRRGDVLQTAVASLRDAGIEAGFIQGDVRDSTVCED